VSNAALSSFTFEIYQFTTGTKILEGSGSEGTLSASLLRSKLKGELSDETDDSSFTARLFIKATDANGKTYMTFIEYPITSETESFSETYQIDPEETFAVMDMLSTLGITDISDISSALAAIDQTHFDSYDPNCLKKISKKIYDGGDPDSEEVAGLMGKAVHGCKYFVAEGELANTSYTDTGTFMRDCVHNDLSTADLTVVGLVVDACIGDYAHQVGLMKQVVDSFGGTAGKSGITTTESISDEIFFETSEAFTASLCDNSDVLNIIKGAMLYAEDGDQFKKNFGLGEGGNLQKSSQAWMGIISKYIAEGDATSFDGRAMNSMLASNGGCDNFWSGDYLDVEAITTIHGFGAQGAGMTFETDAAKREFYQLVGVEMSEQKNANGNWSGLAGKEGYMNIWHDEWSDSGEFAFTKYSDGIITCVESCVNATTKVMDEECFIGCNIGGGGDGGGGGDTKAQLGESCSGNLDCANGLACNGEPSVCVSQGAWGVACNVAQFALCQEGLTCDAGQKKCLVGLNQSCQNSDQCATNLTCDGGKCVVDGGGGGNPQPEPNINCNVLCDAEEGLVALFSVGGSEGCNEACIPAENCEAFCPSFCGAAGNPVDNATGEILCSDGCAGMCAPADK
jgi:hypothetical protein